MSKRLYEATFNDELYTALTCSICLDFYKKPKQLPNCSHTFCSCCLETIAQSFPQNDYLDCPNCRKRSIIPEDGVKGFQANLIAQQLAEKISAEAEVAGDTSTPSKCEHIFNNTRLTCFHCNKRYCNSCMASHVYEIHDWLSEFSESMSRSLQDLKWKKFEVDIADRLESISTQVESKASLVKSALEAECCRILNDAKIAASRPFDSAKEVLRNQSILQKKLEHLRTVSKFDDLKTIHSEILKQEKAIAEAELFLDQSSVHQLSLDADHYQISKVLESWKICSSLNGSNTSVTEDQIEKSFYESMTLINTGPTNDAFNSKIRLPRQICQLNRDRVALIHEVNRISIISWNAKVLSTLKLFTPENLKKELFLHEMAYDSKGNLYVVADGGLFVGSVSLSSACGKMPECVVPRVVARKMQHHFKGIAVNSAHNEIYVGEGILISVYSTQQNVKLRSIPLAVREPYVLNCQESYGRVFLTTSDGLLCSLDLNTQQLTTIANKGAGPGEVHQVSGACFDDRENLLVADARNHRLQVFSPPNYQFSASISLDKLVKQGSMKPFGVASFTPGTGDICRIIVPDYSGHSVCFFECKRSSSLFAIS